MPSDLDLLRIEIETIWLTDERSRLTRAGGRTGAKAPHLVIATAVDGHAVAFGSDVPEALDDELRALAAKGVHAGDAARPPATLDDCARILERVVGPVEIVSGPSYLVPAGVAHEGGVRIRRSDERDTDDLRVLNPPGWEAGEWAQLVDGALGPWAAAVVDGRVASVCHSARLNDRAAEAGTWTDPAFRGRGYAAAVTAAWASLFPEGSRYLFYSTSSANRSSQAVAARLSLRPLGWLWEIAAAAST